MSGELVAAQRWFVRTRMDAIPAHLTAPACHRAPVARRFAAVALACLLAAAVSAKTVKMPSSGASLAVLADAEPPFNCGLIAEIAGDMTLSDDGAPAGTHPPEAPAATGHNIQGIIASGATALGARRLTTDMDTYQAIGPWLTLYEAQGNQHRDVRTQVGPAVVRYFSSRAQRYQVLQPAEQLSGAICAGSANEGACTEAPRLARSRASTHLVDFPSMHRFAGRFEAVTIDPKDIQLVMVTVPMRLVGPDARYARYLARVGAEYYQRAGPIPAKGAHASAGVSRLREVGASWTTISFSSIVGGGIQDPGSGQAIAFLIGHPPPCALDARSR